MLSIAQKKKRTLSLKALCFLDCTFHSPWIPQKTASAESVVIWWMEEEKEVVQLAFKIERLVACVTDFCLSTSWFHVLLLFSFSCHEYVSVPTNSTEAEMKPRFVAHSRAWGGAGVAHCSRSWGLGPTEALPAAPSTRTPFWSLPGDELLCFQPPKIRSW